MAGIFHSTLTTSYDGPGVWSQITHVALPELPDAAVRFERLQQEVAERRRELNEELRTQRLQGLEAKRKFTRKVAHPSANALTLESPLAANEAGQEYRVSFLAAPSVWADANQATGEQDGLLLQVLRKDGTVLAYHVHRPKAWSGDANAQQLSEVSFAYTGDGSGDVVLHLTSSDNTGRFSGAVDDLQIVEASTSRIVFMEDFNKCQLGDIKGEQAGTRRTVYARCSFPGWKGDGINHSHAVALTEGEAPNLAPQIFSGSPAASDNPRIVQINGDLASLTQRLDSARPARAQALAVKDVESPRDASIYLRGDFQSLGDVAPRGFLSAVPVSTSFSIPSGGSGRLQLAQWLTDPGNPLTTRVLVNRIWRHLFGEGLVRSVDYFGVHGETPSHPELLDFLANRFREDDDWSLKTTVRRLVMSRTYRMAAAYDPRGLQIDPDNRLLWRMPRRRLTAESIRDAMLQASGELDPNRGGPSLGLELPDNIRGAGGDVNPPTWGGQIADYVKNRRSIYLPLRRERPTGDLEILSTFDFPHPSEITGARANTTVATQALFLMNAPWVKHHASRLAERLAREEPLDERARVNRLYVLAASRPAETEEIDAAMNFLQQCAQELASSSSAEQARTAAWAQLCHAMLGSNNFLFRE